MNHLTTEPIESKSGDDSYSSGAMATAEKEASSPANGDTGVNKKLKRTRTTFVPPLDPAVGIELRVTRAGMPARRLRINAARCTFGSGEGCTVRLSDTSLRPLHAVILRDNGRILVRGYSVPLEINGELVTESSLKLGDVIRIGQYCFEMIDLPVSDDENYQDESIETSPSPAHLRESTDRKEADASNAASNPKRLKFSQPVTKTRSKASRGSGDRAVLDGLQLSHDNVQVFGQTDELIVDNAVNREPVTSLAQIHVQAKRNSELMAEVASARKREQEANEKLSDAIQKLQATEEEVATASESIVALKAQVALLNDQAQKLTSDALEQQAIASAEQAKLNRSIASLRESGAASQKAEAATRQSLQESIRQRDEAILQRTAAIDAQQLTRAKLEETEAHVRRLKQEAEETADVLTRLKSDLEKSRNRIDELKDVCCGQADQITKLSTALEISQSSELASVTRLKETIDELQNELDASRQRIVVADLERVQLNTLQSTLDKTLQEHLAEKLSWGAQTDTLNHEVETLAAELRAATNDLNRSHNEAEALQNEVRSIRSQIAEVESELLSRPTGEQLQALRSQLAQYESDLENSGRQLEQLRQDYDQLASQRITQELNQREPVQPPAAGGFLPSSLFPVPSLPGSASEDDLPVEATVASNIQEIVASAAADFALLHADGEHHRAQQIQTDKSKTAEPSSNQKLVWIPDPPSEVEEPGAGEVESVSTDTPVAAVGDDLAQSQWHQSMPPAQSEMRQEKSPGSESSWNAPKSDSARTPSRGWNVSASASTGDEPLQPVAPPMPPRANQAPEPETQSQWLKSSHSRTEVLDSINVETPFYTEPMNRDSGEMFSNTDGERSDVDFSPTSRFEDVAMAPPSFQSEFSKSNTADHQAHRTPTQQPVEDEPDVDEQSLLAALIERSEGPGSNWFADYTASQKSNNEDNESEDSEDNQAVLDRLNQYVRENNSTEDEISEAIAESEHNGLDPEASALSLARMLINELDSAVQTDRDSEFGSNEPDPMVKSRRLVGVSAGEEGKIDNDDHVDDDDPSPHVDMRRKDFDVRAFRDSFAGATDEDVIDPNADEAAYSVRSEADQPAGYGIASPTKAAEEEEEDSVEAYMNQLLRRMGQEPMTSAKPADEPAKQAASQFTAPKQQEQTRVKPEMVRPKRSAPELEVPMDQMRELANQSAASAISTSNRKGLKEMRSKAIVDGVQAGVVVICAVVFFYCGMTSSNLSLVWNTAGALAIALSGFFFYEMFRKLKLASKGD
jgi:hypothetical protein